MHIGLEPILLLFFLDNLIVGNYASITLVHLKLFCFLNIKLLAGFLLLTYFTAMLSLRLILVLLLDNYSFIRTISTTFPLSIACLFALKVLLSVAPITQNSCNISIRKQHNFVYFSMNFYIPILLG